VIPPGTGTENSDRPLLGDVRMRMRCSTSGAIPRVKQTENNDHPFPAHMRMTRSDTINLDIHRDHQLPALARITMRYNTRGVIRLATQTENNDHPSPRGEKKMSLQSLGRVDTCVMATMRWIMHSPKVCQNTSIATMMTVSTMILITTHGNQHVGLLTRKASPTAIVLGRLRMMSTMTTTLTATQKCNLKMAHGVQLQRTISRAFSVVNKTTLTLPMMMAYLTQAVVRPTKIGVVIVDFQTGLGTTTMTELQNHRSKGTRPTVIVEVSVTV
jgi:hypothetical protein